MKDIELSLNDLDSVSGGATGGSVLELRLFPVRHRYGAEHPRGLERGEGHHVREDAGGTGLLPVIQPEQQRDLQRRGSGRHPGIGDGRRLTAFTAALCVSVH